MSGSEREQNRSAEPLREERRYAGMTRRTLCLGLGGAAAMMALGGLKYVGGEPMIRPPGGQDEDALVSACIRCQRCVEACPRKVLIPARIEHGIVSVQTPTFDFSENWCDFCAEESDGVPKCVAACPTQALKLPEGAVAESTIIGKAVIKYDWCLAYRSMGCRFCYEACEYDAIELDAYGRPTVVADRCNGCGACESVCVSLKEGSIEAGATSRAIVVVPVEQ